ncbi:hypothetical protein [Nocardia asteroides]|uniref:hypothetical protein n=1 Tax=Nocardia asteroides TaxID=1824 RepID=UPI0033CBA139
MDTVDGLHQQLTHLFSDHITRTDQTAGAIEIVFIDGGACRLWTENGTAHAEFCALQGGAEIWVLAPDRDDVADFLATVQDTLTG